VHSGIAVDSRGIGLFGIKQGQDLEEKSIYSVHILFLFPPVIKN